MNPYTDNAGIESLHPLISPVELLASLPRLEHHAFAIERARQTTSNIIQGTDKRLLAIVGPCSIHDEKAALEYAERLQEAASRFADNLFIVMRVYFEKPRTLLGWKGLISDPHLNGSLDTNYGLKVARRLLINLAELGMPAATEFLDTLIPHYLSDLITWSAIGARTTESQLHRQLASGLPMPVGFKNTTDGNIKIAVDAVNAASHRHQYISIAKNGSPCVIRTKGNKDCHIILRGSQSQPNYSTQDVANALNILSQEQLAQRIMIDCSHGNSMKDYKHQSTVMAEIGEQLAAGSKHIFGVMLESNLVAGKQSIQAGQPLVYGQSLTDACVSWEDTVEMLEKLALIHQNIS